METYKILQRLGKGAQGSVYLAERKDDGQTVVLKKVECNDESEANRAFKEALSLKDLKHPYICGYREFFVMWDKEDSAMYVCIVMDYYDKSDLAKYLRDKREVPDPVDETVLKKWLGQIIEAMIFVHKKKIIHRDLKPSNIFLTSDDSICIGDFGVSTVMQDVRTKTRSTVGSMNWMAPEVLNNPYDERSDVWSIGCIALEMATCSFLETTQMSGKLLEIKHNTQALEELLEEVAKEYDAGLVSCIKTMLCRTPEQRPTAAELAELPYIKECLELSNSVLAERKRRAQSAATGRPLPKDKGTQAVIDYILDNLGNETCVKTAMAYLADVTKADGTCVDTTGKQVVVKAMRDYMSEPDLQTLACKVINNMVVSANAGDILFKPEIVTAIPLSMKSHLECADVQQAGAQVLMSLSADETAAQLIGDYGGIQDILGAMRAHPDNADVCAACCNAIWSLTVNEDNVRISTEEKGVEDVIKALQTHVRNSEVAEAACAALLSLSMEDDNMTAVISYNTVGTILDIMEIHQSEARVMKNACMALAAMVEPDEECAYKVLVNMKDGQDVAGIPVILKVYAAHKDNAEVVENICTLLMELVEYDEICSEVKHMRIGDTTLTEIHKRFKDNNDIMKPCEAALSKLGGKIHLRPPAANNKQRD